MKNMKEETRNRYRYTYIYIIYIYTLRVKGKKKGLSGSKHIFFSHSGNLFFVIRRSELTPNGVALLFPSPSPGPTAGLDWPGPRARLVQASVAMPGSPRWSRVLIRSYIVRPGAPFVASCS